MSLCGHVPMSAEDACLGHQSLELQLQAVVSHLTSVLGIELLQHECTLLTSEPSHLPPGHIFYCISASFTLENNKHQCVVLGAIITETSKPYLAVTMSVSTRKNHGNCFYYQLLAFCSRSLSVLNLSETNIKHMLVSSAFRYFKDMSLWQNL